MLAGLLALACRRPAPDEHRVDLAVPGRCVGGTAAPAAAGEVLSLVQAGGDAIDCYLRAPAGGELRFGLAPAVTREGFAVSMAADDAPEQDIVLARHGEEWGGALGALAGRPVRLRFQNRSGKPLAWLSPRVIGAPEPVAPVLGAEVRPSGRPINILLYVVDALRADRLSLYGNERPTSPTLEALARHGVLFLNAYSAGPNTMGSIPSLFASRFPWQLGGHLRPGAGVAPRPLAEEFRRAGYRTAGFQANFLLTGPLGFERGFDTYEVLREMTPSGPRRVNAEALHARVLEWLGAHRDGPFFVYVQSLDVHDPYDPPPPFRGRFSGGEAGDAPRDEVPGNVSSLPPDAAREIRAMVERLHPERYDDAVAYADHEIGTLLAGLESLGVRERTAVVVTADHGESLGAGGRYLHGHSLREELIHVPLVLNLPWMHGDLRIADVVSLMDVAPTMLDLAGLEVPREYLGRSLLSPSAGDAPAVMGARLTGLGSANAKVVEWYVREGPWKLATDGAAFRLFHVPDDRDEVRDQSGGRPVQAAYLAARLREATQQADATGRAHQLATELGEKEQQEVERSLRALGYIE